MHIASGMFGAVIIDPPALADVDHDLLVQSEVLWIGIDEGNACRC